MKKLEFDSVINGKYLFYDIRGPLKRSRYILFVKIILVECIKTNSKLPMLEVEFRRLTFRLVLAAPVDTVGGGSNRWFIEALR